MELTKEEHRELAVKLNGETWTLLEKPDRTADDDRRMIHTAHASYYHWLHGGTVLNEQRGEWMLARVYTVLGWGGTALHYAQRCQELTDQNAAALQDFDLAFAAEALARVHALLGNRAEATRFKAEARRLGGLIADAEDKQIFEGDLAAGEWFGLI